MKIVALVFALAGISAGILSANRAEPWKIAVTGDLHGYLSPCGCSSPMIGGIRRRATAIEAMGKNVILLDNGGFVKDAGKQSQFKAEAAAEALEASGVSAINLSARDAALGRGTLLNVVQLSGGKLISSQLAEENELGLPRWVEVGPYLTGGVSTETTQLKVALAADVASVDRAVGDLVEQADQVKKIPLLMLSGPVEEARRLAEAHPELALIVYSETGDPPTKLSRVGSTAMVTAGDRGRNLVSLDLDSSTSDYHVTKLGPEVADHKEVSAIFQAYLSRVDKANLLAEWPRMETPGFAGNAKCVSCHAEAAKVWTGSKHHHALETLEKQGQSRDPDCVVCHVVGLSSLSGYRDRASTPQLTDVGCESCHGPGEAHSQKPKLEQMAKVGEKACAPCHTSENSPNFDFKTYWAKIKH